MTTEAESAADSLARLWRGYSGKVYGSYSPLNSALAGAVARSDELLEFVRAQPPHGHDPNMLMAVIQFLVLGGLDHPISTLYESEPAALEADEIRFLLEDLCRVEADRISPLMATRRIQTNEVGRTAGLALGLACAAKSIGSPFALIDAGASAGLNLLLDEYQIDFEGAAVLGPVDSPVRIPCQVIPDHLPLPVTLPPISARAGLDRDPVDLSDPDNVRWLLACIWPGTGRQDRARAAMELAGARPSLVRPGDMVTDLPDLIEEMGDGPVVVVTSWSAGYLVEEDRRVFESVLAGAARRRPVAWVCVDAPGVSDCFRPATAPPDGSQIPSVLGLAVFRDGTVASRSLGYMHSHGAWVHWLDADLVPG